MLGKALIPAIWIATTQADEAAVPEEVRIWLLLLGHIRPRIYYVSLRCRQMNVGGRKRKHVRIHP